MKWYSIFISLVLLLLCSVCTHGQDTKKYVYQDSSILYPETINTVAAPKEPVGEINAEKLDTIFIDTSLVPSQHLLSADSVRAIKNAQQFAYAKKLDSLLKDFQKKQQVKYTDKKEEPSFIDIFFAAALTKIIFWVLAILFIAFIVYKLFFTEGFFQRQTAKSNVSVLEDDDNAHLIIKDYDVLVANVVKQQNYRLATRYLYLQLLQKLTAAGAIEFAADKTNTEYLRELTGKSYKQEAASLTLYYEYVWYGEFAIDANTFSKLESRFKKLNTQL